MRLLDRLRRRRPQARTPPSRAGSSASPSEEYSVTNALHTAVVLNTLSATPHDAASSLDAGPARTSEPPYGPHHTPHDSSSTTPADHGHSSSTDSGSSGSFYSSGPSHDSGGSSGSYDSGSSGSYDSGSTGSI
jgi:hypothetical protein